MTSRIEPAVPPYSQSIEQRLGQIMPPGVPPILLFRVLARDERLFQRFMGGGLLDRGNLTVREREIVILRVCANNRSEYEWGVHVAGFADKAGLDAEQIAATVHAAPNAACWSERDQRLLRLCDTLHTACEVPDADWTELRYDFSEEALLELLLLNGKYKTVSILTNALRLPPEPWAARFPQAAA
jgi:alkylhydroperoxidase family enzyme